jgi:hypothetical protein
MRVRGLLLAAAAFFLVGEAAAAQVRVRGYFKKDGTYVAPHYRSSPDGNFWNNWTTKGNLNPYTGTYGTRVTPPPRYGYGRSSLSSGFDSYGLGSLGTSRSSSDLWSSSGLGSAYGRGSSYGVRSSYGGLAAGIEPYRGLGSSLGSSGYTGLGSSYGVGSSSRLFGRTGLSGYGSGGSGFGSLGSSSGLGFRSGTTFRSRSVWDY